MEARTGRSVALRRERSKKARLARLWKAYGEERDDERRNQLVEGYQTLVGEIVRRFAARLPRSVDRGDLATAGSVGLMAAITSFDPTKGVRFEAYAETRIRGALLDELRSEDWLSRPWRLRYEQQKRALEMLHSELARKPSDAEVASAMGMPLEEYELIFGTTLPGTTPAPSHDPEEALSLEVIADTRLDSPGERLSRDEILRLVAQKLTEQEYRIVYLKYWEELPMREIGDLTRLSESRVSKIHTRLIERLQDRFRVGIEEP